MALVAPQTMNAATWAVPTLSLATVSDTFQAPSSVGQAFAVYRNTSATSRTVTIDLPGTDVYGRAAVDINSGALNLVLTTGELWIPLMPQMGDANGVITITVNTVAAGVTNAHIRIA